MSDIFIRPDVQKLIDMSAEASAPRLSEIGAVEGRSLMRTMQSEFDLPVGDLAMQSDVTMEASDDGRLISLRVYDSRESRDPGPALVYFHGGGFVLGDLDGYDAVCAEIARGLDMPVISVDYRLAPENPWPAGPDDCEAAARWISESPETLGRQITGLLLSGDSAGGGLAIVTSMALRDRPANVPQLALWPIYPVTDLDGSYASHSSFSEGFILEYADLRWFWKSYGADSQHWRASPILGQLGGLPAMLLVTASLDPVYSNP